MNQVPVRELNQDTSGVLARVKAGEELDITERGTVIAHLIPAQPSPFQALIESGKFRPPTTNSPFPRPTGRVRRKDEAGELLRQMRDEERY